MTDSTEPGTLADQTWRWVRTILLAATGILMVTACSSPIGSETNGPDSTARPGAGDAILPVTLTQWMYPPDASPATGEPVGLAHVSVAPLKPGANTIDIILTDLEGQPLPQAAQITDAVLTIQPLAPDAQPMTPPLTRDGAVEASWSAGEVDLPGQGWYELVVRLETSTSVMGEAMMYVLLPDPSVYGTDALELAESDPEAQALYDRALERYAGWDAVRWRESLGSGADVLVVTDFTLTNRPGELPAFRTESRYTGAFRERPDGTSPADPSFDFAGSITIADTAWRRRDGSGWEEMPTRGVSTQEERAEVFSGATDIQSAGTDQINGREVKVITFYLPPKGGQSEAWFAWWIDADTGDLVRLAMVTYMHFMIWDFFDINGSYTIAPPPGIPAATPTGDG